MIQQTTFPLAKLKKNGLSKTEIIVSSIMGVAALTYFFRKEIKNFYIKSFGKNSKPTQPKK